MTSKTGGFSLLELMIALAIMAILAVAANSYFGRNVQAARCTEGRSALIDRSVALEKCKAIYGKYNNANCTIATGNTAKGHFKISLTRSATGYVLRATANSTNPVCTTIILNSVGLQTGTGTSPW